MAKKNYSDKYLQDNYWKVKDYIEAASKETGLPQPLLMSVMLQESSFNPKAQNKTSGAYGYMQLTPIAAKDVGYKPEAIKDPAQNVMIGAKYLRKMIDKNGGDVRLGLAAYNAGPGNVRKYKGVPPFKETQNYVDSIPLHQEAIKKSVPQFAPPSKTYATIEKSTIDRMPLSFGLGGGSTQDNTYVQLPNFNLGGSDAIQ